MTNTADDALEAAMNAEINFENVLRMMPEIRNHPIFMIALAQLKSAIAKMEQDSEADD